MKNSSGLPGRQKTLGTNFSTAIYKAEQPRTVQVYEIVSWGFYDSIPEKMKTMINSNMLKKVYMMKSTIGKVKRPVIK